MSPHEDSAVARLLGRRRQRAEDLRLRLEQLEESARENERMSGDLEARVSELASRVVPLVELAMAGGYEADDGTEG